MSINKELLKGSTSLLILYMLSKQDMYGYQMTKKLESISDNTFTLKEGTLYPILHSLEKDNKVKSYIEETDSLRKRKYYSITKDGLKLLSEKTKEWNLFSTTINKVLGGEELYEQSPCTC